jgi:hypothetical protein
LIRRVRVVCGLQMRGGVHALRQERCAMLRLLHAHQFNQHSLEPTTDPSACPPFDSPHLSTGSYSVTQPAAQNLRNRWRVASGLLTHQQTPPPRAPRHALDEYRRSRLSRSAPRTGCGCTAKTPTRTAKSSTPWYTSPRSSSWRSCTDCASWRCVVTVMHDRESWTPPACPVAIKSCVGWM